MPNPTPVSRAGKGSNYTKGGVTVTGLGEFQARLQVIQNRLRDPLPVLKEIAVMFAAMESQRFQSGGASNFGTSTWDALKPSTIKRREYPDRKGGSAPGGETPLIAHGFLKAASTAPLDGYAGIADKVLTLTINPAQHGASSVYGSGRDTTYAAAQQANRKFVEITPSFRVKAKDIAANYFLAKAGKELIPINY